MRIGIPSETKTLEGRVALVPAAAADLVRRGHEVFIQSGAGLKSGFADEAYIKEGIKIVPVRWIEWSALFLIIGESRSLPFNARANYWILGGVAVSCLCDAVAIVLLDAGVVHLNIC